MTQATSFSEPLLDDIERRYGLRVSGLEPLAGGYECDVALLTTSNGERRVLRVSPAARTVEELAWAYQLAAYAKLHLPETVAPLAGGDGSLVFRHGDRPVSLFPFVAGQLLDRDHPAQRDAAARLLGRLHRVLPAWPGVRPRPDPPSPRPSAPHVAPDAELAAQSAMLADPDLDRFIAAWRASPRLPAAPLHADFYRGNLLCAGDRVVGLLDWDDAAIGSREYELAWSVWELAQAPAPGVTLDPDRALQFLEAYAETGPVDMSDRSFVIPLIRAHLRFEVWRARIEEGQGMTVDHEYIARNVAAFAALRAQRL
ncbi:MAG TPA: phosphotransferase [Longimicrobium sp.]|nr:phosphotransferase [Longimicrobium sp.]